MCRSRQRLGRGDDVAAIVFDADVDHADRGPKERGAKNRES